MADDVVRTVWLAPDASPALGLRRPLAYLARPAAGRPVARQVSFAAVQPLMVDGGGRALVAHMTHELGPTLYGPVAVEAFCSRDAVTDGLRRAPLRHVPVDRIGVALTMYDEAIALQGSSVLLVAYCPVLWPQIRTSHRAPAPWSGLS